jgi:hypothetical protein
MVGQTKAKRRIKHVPEATAEPSTNFGVRGFVERTRYRDVVIHPNVGIFRDTATVGSSPPISTRVDISDQIWIGLLDDETANIIMDTCEPKVFGLTPPIRQYAHLYAFVRELPSGSMIPLWDTDHQLKAAVALSRLIHPTSVGFVYAARVGYESGIVKEIVPAEIRGISRDVFLSPNRTRDWLTVADANALRPLVTLSSSPLPRRVHNALWHHEYAARTYYLDHRWTLLVTGLEALVHTDRWRTGAQFWIRVPMLAAELGITLTKEDTEEAYDLRSQLAHGAAFLSSTTTPGLSSKQILLYDRLEDTLRLAVLRGMQDKAFADIFDSDDNIRTRWPIEP